MCFYFADVGDIQSRLIDHRPVINSEIRYLVKEFEVLHVPLRRLMNRIKVHFIRPTVLVKGWTLQHCFSSFRTAAQVWESWYVLHRGKLYHIICDENLLFYTPKVIYWIESWKVDTSQVGPMLPRCLQLILSQKSECCSWNGDLSDQEHCSGLLLFWADRRGTVWFPAVVAQLLQGSRCWGLSIPWLGPVVTWVTVAVLLSAQSLKSCFCPILTLVWTWAGCLELIYIPVVE